MKIKYVCGGLISLYVNFHNNRTMWSTSLHVNICRWGGKGKEPVSFPVGEHAFLWRASPWDPASK